MLDVMRNSDMKGDYSLKLPGSSTRSFGFVGLRDCSGR